MNEPKNKNAEIPHWFVTGTAPDKYQAGIDQRIFHSGTRSAVLRSTSEDYDTGEYGTIMPATMIVFGVAPSQTIRSGARADLGRLFSTTR